MEKSETTDNPLRLVNPQQNVFYFDEIVIRSDFDNGNIARAERVDKRNVTNFIILFTTVSPLGLSRRRTLLEGWWLHHLVPLRSARSAIP